MLFIANKKIYRFDEYKGSANCNLCIARELVNNCMEYSIDNHITRCHELIRHVIANNSKKSNLRDLLLNDLSGIRPNYMPKLIYEDLNLYKLAYLKHHN